MRLLLLLALVLVPSSAWAGDLPRGLVGFSTSALQGDEGVLGMTAACQADFPTSRMCTSKEVLQTQTLPALPQSTAWVRPVLTPGSTASTGREVVDASGLTTSTAVDMACQGWSLTEVFGLSVDASGAFALTSCGAGLRVACCAAQPQVLGDINQDGSLNLVDWVLARRFLAGEVTVLP